MPEDASARGWRIRLGLPTKKSGYPGGVGGAWLHQAAVGGGVVAEPRGRRPDGTLQHRRLPAVERVGERDVRVDPLQTVLFQRQRAEEGRGVAQRVNRGAEVVDEAGKRDLCRPRAPADGALAFEHGHAFSVAGELYGGRETVGARAYDYGIVCGAFAHALILDPSFGSAAKQSAHNAGLGGHRVQDGPEARVVPDVSDPVPLQLRVHAGLLQAYPLLHPEAGRQVGEDVASRSSPAPWSRTGGSRPRRSGRSPARATVSGRPSRRPPRRPRKCSSQLRAGPRPSSP